MVSTQFGEEAKTLLEYLHRASDICAGSLPDGAVPVTINGMVYYQADGAYFLPVMQGGVTVYTTVQP